MNETKVSDYYDNGHRGRGADMLKFCLMPLVMFALFGFPTRYGNYVQIFSNFAVPAFYILCGFFVLCPDEKRRSRKIKRALKKSFKFFALLFVTYTLINVAYLLLIEANWIPVMLRKRTWFEFLALNIWPLVFPMGNSIWFIQSLFYAYIFFYFADKIKLLRFYLPLLILFYLIMIFTGEFAALAGFPHLGYLFIPGGAITRAIPYMLLGMLIRQNADRVLTLRLPLYIVFFVIGMVLAVLEVFLLSYFHILVSYGHFIGFGIMAVSLCCIALSYTKRKDNFINMHGRRYARRIYALCQPVSFFVTQILGIAIVPKYLKYLMEYKSIIVFFICLVITVLITITKKINMKKNFKKA